MRLTLTLVDTRTEYDPGPHYTARTGKQVEFDRVAIADATASPVVLAGLLRSIADDLDPALRLDPPDVMEMP